ncbi:MAG: exosortase [Deltaproteobacteria bacterium]|nr:MAG: exosortase [Deltaproteobacteria bacterium]
MILNLKKETLVQLLIVLSVFILFFFTTIIELINDWSVNDNFSHGFLVPFISLYMIWYKRDELSKIEIKPSNYGIIIILFGMLCAIAGNLGAELFVTRISMIITLSGIILFLFGTKIFKSLLIPVLYLIIMIPLPAIIWNKIAFPLQLFAAGNASDICQMLGLSVLREGNILHLENTSLEVIDACSGLRSLTSLIALSGAFAFISNLKISGKWILFFSAIPVAVAVNVIRLTITAFTAVHIGPETAHGFLHEISGIIVFITALILLYLIFLLISKLEGGGFVDDRSKSK